MTSTLPPGLLRNAAEVIAEAAKRPILDVEYFRFEGKTKIVDIEMERLRIDAVTPSFRKPPYWHVDPALLGLIILFEMLPLGGIILVYIEIQSLFWIFGTLIIIGDAAFTFFMYWYVIHIMKIFPNEGKFGIADPDQAYKGLVLLVREVAQTEGYGFKLTRQQAIAAHNYHFTIIPSEGSLEKLQLVVYKHYDTDELLIQNSRGLGGESRQTYIKFKNAIEDRLSRQVG
jgi:hypothetical protein